MPMMMTRECPCCMDMLWHCEKCWNKHHNGEKHKDYVPPKHFGQSMMSNKFKESLKKLEGIGLKPFNPSIKEDKNKKYREGEYH